MKVYIFRVVTGEFSLKKRNQLRGFGKGIKCSLKVQQQQPPPAWPGRAVPEPPRQSWDGPKPISIVGSTASIGTQTLDIVAENPDKFRVVALAAGSNVTLLADQGSVEVLDSSQVVDASHFQFFEKQTLLETVKLVCKT